MTGLPCSDGSALVGEQLAGTAPEAVAWLALEQNGPWGAKALTQSHLDPEVGRALEDRAAATGVRPALIRRPGRHADPHGPEPTRRVLVAHTRPGGTWLLEGVVTDPSTLLDLDWAALSAGDLDGVRRSLPSSRPTDRPQLLVCTNAKRDVCCAVKGRPVAMGAAAAHPGQVWEVTHTSGHRFAPTTVLLPSGTLHGRVDVALAGELLRTAARGATVLEGSRGRSTWPGPAQAAELELRRQEGILGLDSLVVLAHEQLAEHRWETDLQHSDGRRWRVETEARTADTERAESCGKALKPMTYTTGVVVPI